MQGKESRVAFFLSIHGLVTETSTIKIERKKHFLISAHLSWSRTLNQGEWNPSALWQRQCVHAVGSRAGICSSAGNGQMLADHRDGGQGLSPPWTGSQWGAALEGWCQLGWTDFGDLLVSAFCQSEDLDVQLNYTSTVKTSRPFRAEMFKALCWKKSWMVGVGVNYKHCWYWWFFFTMCHAGCIIHISEHGHLTFRQRCQDKYVWCESGRSTVMIQKQNYIALCQGNSKMGITGGSRAT